MEFLNWSLEKKTAALSMGPFCFPLFSRRRLSQRLSVDLPGGFQFAPMDVEHGVRVLAERPAEDFEPTEEEAVDIDDGTRAVECCGQRQIVG